jgi:hypothetical protein
MHLRRAQADSSSDSDSDSDDNDDRIEDDSNNKKVSAHSHKLAALPANVDVSLLQQRLVAEQRRAELLEEEVRFGAFFGYDSAYFAYFIGTVGFRHNKHANISSSLLRLQGLRKLRVHHKRRS